MSAAKHTPGPWLYDAEAIDGRERGYIRTEFGRETGGHGIAVARVVSRSEFGPTAYDANARLIAAAPELLAASTDLLAKLAFRLENRGPKQADLGYNAQEALRAAIDKAVGK